MPPDVEIVDVPDEERPLFHALIECGKRYHNIRNHSVLAKTFARLTEPPASLHIPPPDRTELANSLLKAMIPFNHDTAARTLRRDEGQPDSDAKWNALSPAERKRAKRRWAWELNTGLDTTPQGRPHKVDPALVLYCARVVAEGCGQSRFKISRPADGGARSGPMWRALMAALPLAELFLARADSAPPRAPQEIQTRAEAVADIVRTARSKEFDARCREWNLGQSANDVADQPGTFRLALTRARALRNRARQT